MFYKLIAPAHRFISQKRWLGIGERFFVALFLVLTGLCAVGVSVAGSGARPIHPYIVIPHEVKPDAMHPEKIELLNREEQEILRKRTEEESHSSFYAKYDFMGRRKTPEEIRSYYSLNADRLFSEIINSPTSLSNSYINDMPDGIFLAHINGLYHESKDEIFGSHDIVLPDPFNPKNTKKVALLRKEYISYINHKVETRLRERISKFSELDIKPLLDFAEERGEFYSVREKISFRIIEDWFDSLEQKKENVSKKFPFLDYYKSIEWNTNKDIFETINSLNELSDPHELKYIHSAFSDYIKKSKSLNRLDLAQSEKWHFKVRNVDEIWRTLKIFEQPTLGNEPSLVYFLDRAVASSPIKEMSKAWNEKPRNDTRTLTLDHADTNLFLSEFSDKTVLLVGHIVGDSFVQERGKGLPALKINIPHLLKSAQEHNVLLIPIGCNSADAGVPFGFTKPISSHEVAKLLAKIPNHTSTIGEIIASFVSIGTVAVDANGIAQYLDVIIYKPNPDFNLSNQEPSIYIRIPIRPNMLSNQNSATFSSYLGRWSEENRPVLDKGVFGWWRTNYRLHPVLTLFFSGLLFNLIAFGFKWLRDNWIKRKNLVTKKERVVVSSIHIIGLSFIVFSILRLLFYIWEFVLIIGILLIIIVFFNFLLNLKPKDEL